MRTEVAPQVAGHVVGAFDENCWLVVDPATNRAVLVDPGAEGERLVRAVEASGATLDAIWLTHACGTCRSTCIRSTGRCSTGPS